MSYPKEWAEHHAPVRDIYEKVILTELANNADPDGCDAFTSRSTLMREALCEESTVKRRLAALQKRGLIRRQRDDPSKPMWLQHQPRYRTVPYELMIPHSWWSDDQRATINRTRADRGTNAEPITPELRPDLPSRARQGVPTDPPEHEFAGHAGGSHRPP